MSEEPEDEMEGMRKLIDGLGIEVHESHVTVSTLTDRELISRFGKVTETLLQRGEVLHPTTETGKDLHSERDAYMVELHRRKLR